MKNFADKWLLLALVLTVEACAVFEVCRMGALASLCFTLTFPMTAALWLLSVRQRLEREDVFLLVTLGAVVLSVIFGAMKAGFVTAAGLKKTGMLMMTLLYFRAAEKTRLDEKADRILAGIVDFLSLFLLGAALFIEKESGNLTLHFGNPNLAGLFLTCLFMLQMEALTRGRQRIFHGLLALGLGILVLLTRSRNCILICGIYLLGWALAMAAPNRRFTGLLAAGTAALPGLFAGAYLILVPSRRVQELLQFVTGKGKPLDSRLELWRTGLQSVLEHPLFGDLFRLADRAQQGQLHNSHLEIAGFFGLPVLILVFFFIFRLLWQKKPQSRGSFAASLGFAACVALGIGEAAMFSGGLGIYVLMGLFLLRRNGDAE